MSQTPGSDAAPRCPRCCVHGLPFAREDQRQFGTVGWCGWCQDIAEGYGDDCRISPGEPQWLCPHGIGEAQ
jgi:hypothetical protein